MKTLLFLLLNFVIVSAQASSSVKQVLESQARCYSFVRFNEESVFMGSGPTQVRVISRADGTSADFPVGDFLVDAILENGQLYALTASALEVWDVASKTRLARIATQNLGRQMETHERPTGFLIFKGLAFVSHGRLGVMVVDLKTQKLVEEIPLVQKQSPKESMATAILAIGETAYVLMDNYSLSNDGVSAFRGLISLNLNTRKVMAELGEIDPGADALATDGKKMFISYGGMPIWKFPVSGFGSGSQMPRIERRISQLDPAGHPVGIPSVDETNYYTCFYGKTDDGRRSITPKIFDRREKLLD